MTISAADIPPADYNEVKARVTAQRAAASCLMQYPQIMGWIAEAHALKNATVRAEVLEILRCALENADDTATERGYARECAQDLCGFVRDYPTRAKYWEGMFFSSAQSCSCESRYLFGKWRLHGGTFRWLHRRGLMG
jgi:hypothetical protein